MVHRPLIGAPLCSIMDMFWGGGRGDVGGVGRDQACGGRDGWGVEGKLKGCNIDKGSEKISKLHNVLKAV